ncbi:MAG: glycosyltransferase [Endomicrobiales bacterium]
MMKLLFVIYSIHGGGAERVLQQLLARLDRKVFRPELCVFKLTGREKEVVPADVPVHVLETALRPASLFLLFKLASLFRSARPDRAVSFMWGANLIALLAGKVSGTKVFVNERIYTPRDIDERLFGGLYRPLISGLYKQAGIVIAVSRGVAEGLIKGFGVPEGIVRVIPNGVDAAALEKRAKEFLPPLRNYLVACGRLEPQKNFGLLIEAVEASGTALPLVILGKGPQKSFLEEKARAHGVELHLPGYAENPYPWIKNASLFLMTSLYEGMPNALLEAMALKVPVAAARCPGVDEEVIVDGITGILAEQSPGALARAIREVTGDPSRGAALADKAFSVIQERFSLQGMVAGYERVLSRGNAE